MEGRELESDGRSNSCHLRALLIYAPGMSPVGTVDNCGSFRTLTMSVPLWSSGPKLGFPIDSGTLDLFTPGIRKRGAGSDPWVKAVQPTN